MPEPWTVLERRSKVLDINTGEHLTRPKGFDDLGMHERAGAELEELPPGARTDPRVLELRLRIAPALKRWSLGEVPAGALECGEMIARFHRACVLSMVGNSEASREPIGVAVKASEMGWSLSMT